MWFAEVNLLHRDRIAEYNQAEGLSSSKSFLKIMSYHGAIRVPFDYPEGAYLSWKDHTGRYIDPGNRVYAEVLRACWPSLLPTWYVQRSHPETTGDLLEALLGIAWLPFPDFRRLTRLGSTMCR